jgi:hypothetical protein
VGAPGPVTARYLTAPGAATDRRRLRDYVAPTVATGLVLLGLAVSTVTANTAVTMGEVPVTLLPGGRWLAALGLPALVTARAATVGLASGLTARLAPRYRLHAVAAAGLGWLLWGVWQFWVLLALT